MDGVQGAQVTQDEERERNIPREIPLMQEGKDKGDAARLGEAMTHRSSGGSELLREVAVAAQDSVSSSIDGLGSGSTNVWGALVP